MKHLKLTFVGLLALTAAASDAFAQGPPGPPPGVPPMGGPPIGGPPIGGGLPAPPMGGGLPALPMGGGLPGLPMAGGPPHLPAAPGPAGNLSGNIAAPDPAGNIAAGPAGTASGNIAAGPLNSGNGNAARNTLNFGNVNVDRGGGGYSGADTMATGTTAAMAVEATSGAGMRPAPGPERQPHRTTIGHQQPITITPRHIIIIRVGTSITSATSPRLFHARVDDAL